MKLPSVTTVLSPYSDFSGIRVDPIILFTALAVGFALFIKKELL